MPWSASSFSKHDHALSSPQSAHAARVANAIVRRGGDEGVAIATAIKREKRADGGALAPAGPASTYQQFQSMTPDQLQAFVMRAANTPQGQLAARLLAQKRAIPWQDQSQQQPQQGYAGGGLVHGFAGGGATDAGFLHSSVPGRTDHIPASPAADSYVVPADVVSGLGEGNSLAGARVLDLAFGTGPYGTKMPQQHMGSGPPRPPAPAQYEARGGSTGRIPIMAAGGEYIVPPHVVAALGRGDAGRGHRLLDKFVVEQRRKIIGQMRKLPGPVKR